MFVNRSQGCAKLRSCARATPNQCPPPTSPPSPRPQTLDGEDSSHAIHTLNGSHHAAPTGHALDTDRDARDKGSASSARVPEHGEEVETYASHTISQRIRSLKKIPPELIPIGVVLFAAVFAAFYSLLRKFWVDKTLRLRRTGKSAD
ncbi:hypothetical protein LTR56_010384 [Elasticomyces elasticus]|nr:hypothetical protein LTR56_010384 [Elasticomyces elasticus]KAK3656951.1 hypothetical protein LTR22_009614 [Elasticomyces elasticus]KAK4926046.1 hypothetical protein LTR49_006960 [Elasticomyces elasticus]KAK5766183.1 hypothetical protein LTS12_003667 [Elasticomyces elasticus]